MIIIFIIFLGGGRYDICNANYCFTDNEADSAAARVNRARLDLAAGNYVRTVDSPADPEFTITFTFNTAVTFESLTLKKAGDVGDYLDVYNGICLTVTDVDNNPSSEICTDTTFGFTNGNAAGSTESFNAVQDILFDGLGQQTNIKSAQLTFDTSASGSNLSADDLVEIAQITIDSFVPAS